MTSPQASAYSWASTGAPTTREQAISSIAQSMELQWTNGNAGRDPNNAGFSQPYWANSWWTSHGLPLPPQSAFGNVSGQAGATPVAQDPALFALFSRAAAAVVAEDPTYSRLSSVPGSADAVPSPNQQSINATSTANTAANNATSTANTNATIAGNAADTAANNAGSLARTNATIAGNAADTAANNLAAGQRNDASIAGQAANTAANNASAEKIAAAGTAEKAREFDVSTAEGARQFNVNAEMTLLDKGIALAQKPVDWLGYQYWMKNMGIPLNAINVSAATSLLGAVPPTGPSAAGPIIGGAGVIHGDNSMAQAAGVQPQAVSVQQAVQANPGSGGTNGVVQNSTAAAQYPQWVQAAGGNPAALETALNGARAQQLPQLPQNDFLNATVTSAQQQATQAATGAPTLTPTPPAAQAPAPPTPDPSVFNSPLAVKPGAMPTRTPTPLTAPSPVVGAPMQQAAPPTPVPMQAPQLFPQVSAGMHTLPINVTAPSLGQPNVPNAGPQIYTGAPIRANVSTGDGSVGGSNGIYTGPSQSATVTPAATPGGAPTLTPTSVTGASNPQGTDMINAIAGQLGMTSDQIQKLIDPNLLAGGYSLSDIMNSPAIKQLQDSNNNTIPYYRTGDPNASKFGYIQAFGIPTGLRGGQDLNYQSYNNDDPMIQQQIQGAIQGTGLDPATELAKSMRASPMTNYNPGVFGVRASG